MLNDESKKRFERLFSTMQDFASSEPPNGSDRPKNQDQLESTAPDCQELEVPNPAVLIQEVQRLQARLLELEAQLEEQQTRTVSSPLLYEKEEVGFVCLGDKLIPVREMQPAAPGEGTVIKAPLLSSGTAIGEVRVAQPPAESLSDDDVLFANTIAQQVSIQIENLRLLAATERARQEAEEATHQFTHRSWENFLDGIHNNERIGYLYEPGSIEPFTLLAPAQYDHEESIEVLDEQVGRFFVKGEGSLGEEDTSLIHSVAQQVGQQVENIRLLADAARARAEAEEATRRLTRQNWETYAEQKETTVGFVYDSIKVFPLGEATTSTTPVLEQPLTVHDESIGQLAVSGLPDVSEEEREIAAAIALQTSIHLEALRLTEELQKRAQELTELDRLKNAFLANMSHELRTPLNSILGFADVMLEGLDGELTAYMDNDLRLIQKNGQHLLHLINDVLDMAKIDSGRMNLHPETFQLHDLLQEVCSITSTLASEKNLALFIEEGSDRDIKIYADNTRIRQIMINLVNNAIKFTEKGKISICAKPIDGARILITVKDTGIGIPPDKLEDIFEEFTQVDTSTTRKVGGTGLGLPISRRLAELHGGRLWAESTNIPGEGSTFLVELPVEARITDVIEKREK